MAEDTAQLRAEIKELSQKIEKIWQYIDSINARLEYAGKYTKY